VETAWFEDDRFWRQFGVAAFGAERWCQAADELPALMTLLGLTDRPGRVLDLCCGPGRHSIALASAGVHVTAVDRNADYLSQLRTRAATTSLAIETVRADMREFVRPGAFDAALCIGLSFGYLERDDEDVTVLRNLRRSLAPGGRLVLDAPTPVWPRELEPWFLVKRPEFGALVQVERSAGDASVVMRWSFQGVGADQEPSVFVQRLYTPERLRDLFLLAGFGSVTVFGGFDRSRFDEHARKAVVVGVAPGS